MIDLSKIKSFDTRWTAYGDYDAAVGFRQAASWLVRWKPPGWRFDHRMEMRRALKAWKRFKAVARSAK